MFCILFVYVETSVFNSSLNHILDFCVVLCVCFVFVCLRFVSCLSKLADVSRLSILDYPRRFILMFIFIMILKYKCYLAYVEENILFVYLPQA
jgi:hypothetical protein